MNLDGRAGTVVGVDNLTAFDGDVVSRFADADAALVDVAALWRCLAVVDDQTVADDAVRGADANPRDVHVVRHRVLDDDLPVALVGRGAGVDAVVGKAADVAVADFEDARVFTRRVERLGLGVVCRPVREIEVVDEDVRPGLRLETEARFVRPGLAPQRQILDSDGAAGRLDGRRVVPGDVVEDDLALPDDCGIRVGTVEAATVPVVLAVGNLDFDAVLEVLLEVAVDFVAAAEALVPQVDDRRRVRFRRHCRQSRTRHCRCTDSAGDHLQVLAPIKLSITTVVVRVAIHHVRVTGDYSNNNFCLLEREKMSVTHLFVSTQSRMVSNYSRPHLSRKCAIIPRYSVLIGVVTEGSETGGSV